MKIVITERQLGLLIEQNEKPKVYTDKKEYDKAMKEYKKQLDFYNYSLKVKKYMGKYDMNYQSNWWYAVTTEPYVNTFLKIVHSKMPNWVSLSLLESFEICGEKRDGYKEILKAIGNPKIIKWHKVEFGTHMGGNYTYYYLPEVKEPIKPIYKEPVVIKPVEKPRPITPEPVTPKEEPNLPTKQKPTPFSVTWRMDNAGKYNTEVTQNTHYFKTYDEWKEFVNSHPNALSKNENGSRTEASALYSGIPADISADEIKKGPM